MLLGRSIHDSVSVLKTIHRAVFPAMELILGMAIAQLIATAQVYASNLRLFDQMTAVAAAGYLPVPNQQVLPRLLEPGVAFWGGLFFTLTIGAGLSLVSVGAAGIWRRFPSARRFTAPALAAALALAAVSLNRRGFDAWATLYLIAVPGPVFWLAARWRPPGQAAQGRRLPGLRLLTLVLLALGCAGEKVSAFYYRFTLYPAEVFKSLDQRQIKTILWPPEASEPRRGAVGRDLIRLDYLPVEAPAPADLSLRLDGGRLALVHAGRPVWEDTIDRFLADPRRAAADASARTDRFAVFRAAAYYGVLLAFPATLYVLLFALIRLVCGIAVAERRAEAAAAIVCLLAGFWILADFHLGREKPPPPEAVAAALESPRWQRRVAALKAAPASRFDVTTIPGYAARFGSPYPQERYWLARALATCPNPQATGDLIRLLADPQLNVRTMAIQALGRRNDPAAVQPILDLLQASDEWYDQMYAYQALRALRWDQTRLR